MGKLKSLFAKAGQKVRSTAGDIKKYWHTPKEGNYVSYKEFTLFNIGASGSNSAITVLGYLQFAAGCFLVGSIYEIRFMDIYLISLINMPFGYL